MRDHWNRGYAGALTCTCGWKKTEGLVNRCGDAARISTAASAPRTILRRSHDVDASRHAGDFRRHVDQGKDLKNCRDANEDHGKSYEGTCEAHPVFVDPCESPDSECWTVMSFADPSAAPREKNAGGRGPAAGVPRGHSDGWRCC